MDDKRFRRYLACGLFVFVGLCLVADWQGLFDSTDAKTVFGILCDGFTFPGVLLTGVGGLKWISTTGFFDIWGYGGKTLWIICISIKRSLSITTIISSAAPRNGKRRAGRPTFSFRGV